MDGVDMSVVSTMCPPEAISRDCKHRSVFVLVVHGVKEAEYQIFTKPPTTAQHGGGGMFKPSPGLSGFEQFGVSSWTNGKWFLDLLYLLFRRKRTKKDRHECDVGREG